MDNFLAASEYIDFDADNIQALASELLSDGMSDIEKARVAFEFVRDEIPHSFDCGATVITARASDVLKHRTGICHATLVLWAEKHGNTVISLIGQEVTTFLRLFTEEAMWHLEEYPSPVSRIGFEPLTTSVLEIHQHRKRIIHHAMRTLPF